MRGCAVGGVRYIAPLGESAGTVLKAPEMVSNERKGR
jgi:hypothetical protein